MLSVNIICHIGAQCKLCLIISENNSYKANILSLL